MEITFPPELEAALRRISTESGRPADQVVVDLVSLQLDHDALFRQEVRRGIASLDRGESLSHKEVGQRMQQILQS